MTNENITKSNVLVLISNFLPGYKTGGPLTSMLGIIDNLSEDYFFEILTSDRDMGDKIPYEGIKTNTWIEKEKYKICYLKSGVSKFIKIISFINSSNSDILYLNSLFSPFFSIFIILANKIGLLKPVKIIVAPKGEIFKEALNFKRNKKKFYLWIATKCKLYENVYWHSSTEVEKELIIKKFRIEPDRIHIALNLVQKNEGDIFEVKNVIKITSEGLLRIIFLSRISKDKNIVFIFDILKEIKSSVVFDIYGPIEDAFIWEVCKNKISKLPANIVVEYKGAVPQPKVKEVFCLYDLMFLPTFAENFGHVIAESLSVGTPVLLSDNTPWRNLESRGYGWDLPLNKPELFISAIEFMSNLTCDEKMKWKLKIKENIVTVLSNSEILEANRKLFKSK